MNLRASLVRLPLLSPFTNSRETVRSREALLLEYGNGRVHAYAECVTDRSRSSTGEDNETAIPAMRALAKALRGGPMGPREFLAATEHVNGNPMAKGAVEALLWDYRSKVEGRPLDDMLGSSKGRAEAGIALGMGRVGEVRSQVEESLDLGYKRVKVKIDRRGAVGLLGSLREAFPSAPLSADANGCFSLKDLDVLKKLDRFELEYLEQPLAQDDLRGHSRLSREISTPLCLDESVTGLETAREVLDLAAASVINVKPGRVGGVSVAIDIARLARARGAHAWVGGMLETGVGRALNVALASQREFDYPGDTSPNARYFERDIVRNPFEMRSGTIRPNKGPGLGVELDRGAMRRATLKTWKIL